ncbi:MAG: NUDIX hydrolase [Ruminococcus sp.]|nr:NUDIX hydrolase [Ruminococcus sp.]MBR1393951.1 NUDIX hydrolase [Ruminococcus sp.]
MPEYFDLYNERLEPLGELHERGITVPDGKFHIVVTVLSVNFENKVLITRRDERKTYGGFWEMTEGAVIAGETPLQGAVRELKEETGLTALPEALDYRGQIVFKRSHHNHIVMFYLFRADFHEEDIVLQPGETTAARLVYPAEIEQMAKDGEFLSFAYQRLKAVFPDIFGENMP